MKRHSSLLLCLFLFLSSAALGTSKKTVKNQCPYGSFHNEKVTWTAYKAPKKIGVSGSFDQIKINFFPSLNLDDYLRSLQFNINTKTVNTKNSPRDATIYKFFFSLFSPHQFIRGFVQKVSPKDTKSGSMEVLLSMNGKQKIETLTYSFDNKKKALSFKGSIDVLDYGLGKPLASLNRECSGLHEGKTWSDVAISFKMTLNPCFYF